MRIPEAAKSIRLWVVIDAALTVVVFVFVLVLAHNQNAVNAKTECWAGVLDNAVRVMPSRSVLLHEARQCVQLGTVTPPNGRPVPVHRQRETLQWAVR